MRKDSHAFIGGAKGRLEKRVKTFNQWRHVDKKPRFEHVDTNEKSRNLSRQDPLNLFYRTRLNKVALT